MKQMKKGILGWIMVVFAAMLFSMPVGANESPPDEIVYSTDGELKEQWLGETQLLAQATTETDVGNESNNVLDGIENVANGIIDSVETWDEIAEKGLYYIKNVPKKGDGPGGWISYIIGILGLLVGIFFFIKNKYVKPKRE